MAKEIVVLKRPDQIKLFFDERMAPLIDLLCSREMTVSQIAIFLEMKPGTVYHYIKKLLKAGLIVQSKRVKKRNLIEKYYRSIARAFNFDLDAASAIPHAGTFSYLDKRLEDDLRCLVAMGYDIPEGKIEAVKNLAVSFQRRFNSLLEQIGERKETTGGFPQDIQREAFGLAQLVEMYSDGELMEYGKRFAEMVRKS